MTRSHPPTLATLVRRLVREHALVREGDTVLVAVSGGPDSMALLDVLAHLRHDFRFRLVAHGVDHGLRDEAAAELDLARQLSASRDVVFDVSRVTVARGGNLHARARDARWSALRAAAARASATVIATGHHAQDRAETVLLRLLQGASPRGLACLLPREGDRIRPMLLARRADVLAHLERHAIPFACDPSNDDPRYVRARIRNELLPLLETLSPGIVDHLNGLSDDLALVRDAFPPGLRRAHRREAAKRLGGAVVRLPGGQDALVTLAGGRFMITKNRKAAARADALARVGTTNRDVAGEAARVPRLPGHRRPRDP